MKKRIFCLSLLLILLLGACQQPSPPDNTPSETTAPPTVMNQTTESKSQSEAPTETEPDDGRIVVEVTCPLEDAVVFSGGDCVQDVTDTAFVPVCFEIKRGYVYEGYEINGQVFQGNEIALESVTKDTKVTLLLDYVTRELPIVRISTGDAPIYNSHDYVEMNFDLVNTEDEVYDAGGGIRLRGNSTQGYPKKPYRIKFNQKVSLFGMDKAKSWVLLADYLDPSCMHNTAAFYLGAASKALRFTPTAHHVNLYINGELMGLYTLCEQVQKNDGRMNLKQTITPDMTDLDQFNFYVCLDEDAQFDPEAVLGQDYFYVAWCNKYFSLKYPKKEDFCSDEQFFSFFAQLEKYYNKVLDACRDGNTKKMKAYMDVDSLIDHMIIDQIMGERDHVWKSFYSYQIAGEKLAFGPVWDYDYSLYVPWTNEPNEYYTVDDKIEYSNEFFRGVARSDELYGMLCERYQTYYSEILTDCILYVQNYHANIDESLSINDQLWYANKDDITDRNYQFLLKFLKNRKKVLDREWK